MGNFYDQHSSTRPASSTAPSIYYRSSDSVPLSSYGDSSCAAPVDAKQVRMARLNEPPAASNVALSPVDSIDTRKSTRPVFNLVLPLVLAPYSPHCCTMRTKSRQTPHPPPADLDEVKRRFVRQNRELAKNNSTQSLRIRNLEIEVSRLLTVNLDLREQVLHLQNTSESASATVEEHAVERVKNDLRAKIAELSGLVDGLDAVVLETSQLSTHDAHVVQGPWRERQPLIEAMRENQMPTIAEDKLYPRRTLGADEIRAIRLSDHDSNGSPDLGPPPVAHFDDEDPVKPVSLLRSCSSDHAENDGLPTELSANLETRRSRKGRPSQIHVRQGSLLASPPTRAEPETTALMLRTGAKRKLADRDLDQRPIKPPNSDGFSFTRRGVQGEMKTGPPKSSSQSNSPREECNDEETKSRPKPARKVLGDKSINMSPRKAQPLNPAGPDKSGQPAKPDKDGLGNQPGARRVPSIPVPCSPEHVISSVEIGPPAGPVSPGPPPETPTIPQDMFSPTPSEASIGPDRNRDTPPPSDLISNNSAAEGARPARRVRSTVNYAEPSLVAKMRRPGKQLADAISGLQDPRLAMNASSTRENSTHTGTAVMKSEVGIDEKDWKSFPASTAEPTSPLRKRSTGTSIVTAAGAVPSKYSSSSILGPPDISAATRKRRTQPQQGQAFGMKMEQATKEMENMDIYELEGSSSPSAESTAMSLVTKASRRHSSVPRKTDGEVIETKDDGSREPPPKPAIARSERAASRRRSMML